jgi:hypothetical protein
MEALGVDPAALAGMSTTRTGLRMHSTPPSTKYKPVDYPPNAVMQRASSPPNPTLPRKPNKGIRTSKALGETLKGGLPSLTPQTPALYGTQPFP